MTKSICVALFVILAANASFAQHELPSVAIESASKAVKIGTTMQLVVEADVNLGVEASFEWTAQRGVIMGRGNSVMYSAPDGVAPGFDIVAVTIYGISEPPITRYAALFLYKQFVILKADDYVNWNYLSPHWKYYLEYLAQRQIKTSAGLVVQCIEPSWSELPGYEEFIEYTKDQYATGYVEFWNHGYDHSYAEFSGKAYDVQKQRLDKTQALARQVLGITFSAFNAPYSMNDAVTVEVINDSIDIEAWMFASGEGSIKTVLGRGGGEIESSTGVPSWNAFMSNYSSGAPVVVLQHHPGHQSFRDKFSEFEGIIDYLVGRGATFIQPSEYTRLITRGRFALQPNTDTDKDGKPDVIEGQGDSDGDGLPDFLDVDGPDVPPEPVAAFALTADTVAVRSGETVHLALASPSGIDPQWTYSWRAPVGTLTPNGAVATYQPPKSFQPRKVVVTVDVNKWGVPVASCSLPLMLYKQFVLLKADDWLRDVDYDKGIGDRWQKYINYLREKNIKTSVGLVGNSLDLQYPYPGENQWGEYVQYSKSVYRSGLVDFFNHGYDHIGSDNWAEFWQKPFSFQRDHLEWCNQLARDVLGVSLTGFGAPFNAFDYTTTKAVTESQDTQLWIYGPPEGSDKTVLDRLAGEIEPWGVGVPNYWGFLEGYDAAAKYAVLQHHPNYQEFQENFYEFEMIIDDLLERGATFVTFNEYYRILHDKILPDALALRPVIVLSGMSSVVVPVKTPYSDSGATAHDKDGRDISDDIVVTGTVNTNLLGSYMLTYNVTDSAGNVAFPVTRKVDTVDTVKPVIKRIGSSPVTVKRYATYNDAGATATDNYDGNITGKIVVTSNVNTSRLGTYTVKYNVTDSSGNAAIQKTRTVKVVR